MTTHKEKFIRFGIFDFDTQSECAIPTVRTVFGFRKNNLWMDYHNKRMTKFGR